MFKGFNVILMDFMGFNRFKRYKWIKKDLKGFNGIKRDLKGFIGILHVFKGF